MQPIVPLRLFLVALVLVSACLGVTGVATAATETGGEAGENATESETTAVATDEPISGFTLGAGVLAVLIGGCYQLLRS